MAGVDSVAGLGVHRVAGVVGYDLAVRSLVVGLSMTIAVDHVHRAAAVATVREQARKALTAAVKDCVRGTDSSHSWVWVAIACDSVGEG